MVDLKEINKELILSSLNNVGPSKSLGYLPLQTVHKQLSMKADDLARLIREKGLQAKIFSVEECCINSGAIYVYDLGALQNILDKDRAILEANTWPSDADQFVRHVAKFWLELNHPVYPVIQRAFGGS
jgi:hypothetical protein